MVIYYFCGMFNFREEFDLCKVSKYIFSLEMFLV